MWRLRLVSGLSIAALVLGSCGGTGSSRSSPKVSGAVVTRPRGAVKITEHDYALALETTTVAAGSVALNIRNNGPSAHELLAFRTDLPEDQLPLSRTPASLGGAAG